MALLFWVNISSGNGLFPDGTKCLTEPILTFPNVFPFPRKVHTDDNSERVSWAPLQYKDSLPVQEIPLWRKDSHKIFLSSQWYLLYWYDSIFILNKPTTTTQPPTNPPHPTRWGQIPSVDQFCGVHYLYQQSYFDVCWLQFPVCICLNSMSHFSLSYLVLFELCSMKNCWT